MVLSFYKVHVIFSIDLCIRLCKLLDFITEHNFFFFSIKDKLLQTKVNGKIWDDEENIYKHLVFMLPDYLLYILTKHSLSPKLLFKITYYFKNYVSIIMPLNSLSQGVGEG